MRIAIYQDYVHNNGALMMALQDRGIHYAFFDAEMIIGGALSLVDALIMPGGADLYYVERLTGAGNTEIKNFIANGGGYLGICAGAYYACSSLDWNCGEIAGARELALIDARADGPIHAYMEDSLNKSWYGAAPLKTEAGEFLSAYVAGPVFKNVKDADVLASYPEGPAVIAKGKVVLSSPHIEYTGTSFLERVYDHNNPSAEYEWHVGEKLQAHDDAQNAFFDFILERLASGG